MTHAAFAFISKWKHLPRNEFTELFLTEVPRFGLRALGQYRQSVHFEETHDVDEVAIKLQLGLPTEYIPIKNSGAGDCLFKAISQSLYGVEDHHKDLRLTVFIWMVKNEDAVVQIKEKYKHFTTDSEFSLTLQVGTPHTWMGVAHIACSAIALNVHISTFYPYVNGLENTTAMLLNTIFNCKAVGNEVSINIQWSSITFNSTEYWEPNHFVSLLSKVKQDYKFKISTRGIVIVDSDDEGSDDFSNDLDGTTTNVKAETITEKKQNFQNDENINIDRKKLNNNKKNRKS